MAESDYDDVGSLSSEDDDNNVKAGAQENQNRGKSSNDSSSDESIKRSKPAENGQKTHAIKPKPKTRKNAWNQGAAPGNNFDDLGNLPPTYNDTQRQDQLPPQSPAGPYLHQTSQPIEAESAVRRPLCPGLAFSVLWFLAIIAIGIPVAMIIAILYVLLIPIGACAPTFMVAMDGMLFIIKLPFLLSRNMITMAKCDGDAWDIKNLNTV
jgi:hypothetical protein